MKKALLLLSLGFVFTNNANSISKHSNINFTVRMQKSEITAQTITEYLQSNGHTVITTPIPRNGGTTWVCITTIKDEHTYLTTVYVEGEYIVDYEDSMVE